eukprot:13641807-Ditylum_brightwellii.AAC.1
MTGLEEQLQQHDSVRHDWEQRMDAAILLGVLLGLWRNVGPAYEQATGIFAFELGSDAIILVVWAVVGLVFRTMVEVGM